MPLSTLGLYLICLFSCLLPLFGLDKWFCERQVHHTGWDHPSACWDSRWRMCKLRFRDLLNSVCRWSRNQVKEHWKKGRNIHSNKCWYTVYCLCLCCCTVVIIQAPDPDWFGLGRLKKYISCLIIIEKSQKFLSNDGSLLSFYREIKEI